MGLVTNHQPVMMVEPSFPHQTEAGWVAITFDTTTTRTFDVKFWVGKMGEDAIQEGHGSTPWKINRWNIQITHLEGKMIFPSPYDYVPC